MAMPTHGGSKYVGVERIPTNSAVAGFALCVVHRLCLAVGCHLNWETLRNASDLLPPPAPRPSFNHPLRCMAPAALCTTVPGLLATPAFD